MVRRILLLVVAILAVAACAPAAEPVAPSSKSAPAAAKPGAAQEWESLVAAAQKEGTVFLAGTDLGAGKEAMKKAFPARYGIDLEIMDGRSAEIIAKLKAERQAGLHLEDVALMGISTFVLDVRPLNITVPVQPWLVSPEVLDAGKWQGGQLPFIDKDRHAIAIAAMAIPAMIVNTDLVGKDEIRQHADLLQPKWRGKIIMSDPSTSGAANNWFTHMVTRVFGQEKGLQFMRDLARQEVMVTRDIRLFTEWVARGKYPVGIGQSMQVLAQFKEAGAPLGFPKLLEPPYLSGGSGNLFAFERAPHPNAARLFVNWLLGQEGGRVWAVAQGYPSLRLDVSNDHVEPALVPPPGTTYKGEDDYVHSRLEMRKVAGEIFK